MNSCMIFQAHVAALAPEVSVVKEKLVFFAAVCPHFLRIGQINVMDTKCCTEMLLMTVWKKYQILFFFAETLWF